MCGHGICALGYIVRAIDRGFCSYSGFGVLPSGRGCQHETSPALLLDNVASNLATNARESTPPFQKDIVPDLAQADEGAG